MPSLFFNHCHILRGIHRYQNTFFAADGSFLPVGHLLLAYQGDLRSYSNHYFDKGSIGFLRRCKKEPGKKPVQRLSKNCRLIQKEPRLQGEKGLEKGAEPSFPFEIGHSLWKSEAFSTNWEPAKKPVHKGIKKKEEAPLKLEILFRPFLFRLR